MVFREGILLMNDVPVIIVTRKFIVDIQTAIEKISGITGAKALLYRIGFKSAVSLAEILRKRHKMQGEDLFMKIIDVVSRVGWGSFKPISMEKDRIVIRVHHSYGEEFGNVGRDVCYIWQGGIAGAANAAFGWKVRGKETKCVGRGDPYCEFVAEPS